MPLIVIMFSTTCAQSIANSLGGQAEHRDLAAVRHRAEHLAQGDRPARHLHADVEALPHAEVGHDCASGAPDVSAATVTPTLRASSSRYGDTSVITTWRAPACRATAAAMMPIGPAPVISTSSPTTGKSARCAPRCRTGRRSRRRPGRCRADAARRWSRAARCTRRRRPGGRPRRPWSRAHWTRRPARQLRHRPQTRWPSPLTRSPTARSCTSAPISTISPTNSWPMTSGAATLRLGPAVPLADVQVGAAHPGAQDPDQHIVPADGRLGHVLEPQSGLGPALTSAFMSLAPQLAR